jgi:glycosyltransferase involved in cell wall biosynthesis
MKVAIVHDWLVTNAGAEKVLKEIVALFPQADIFALVDFLSDDERLEIIQGKPVSTSFLAKLPLAQKHFRNYLPLFPKAIESLDLKEYDLIISSSWAVAKGIQKSINQQHICYCHTPIRYAWDLYKEYTSNLKQPKKYLVQEALQYIRQWDLKTSNRVDFFIANSHYVANRIRKTYDRNSVVIHPPVNTDAFTLHTPKEDFYLTASRLVPYKKTKMIVEAFNTMPDKKLLVIGKGEEYEEIKAIAKPNIEVLGYQSDEVLRDNMQRAKGFIFMAVEDFGIIPVEAMACGTPIIAYGEGGIKDSVINGKTGLLFEQQSANSLSTAIKKFESMSFEPKLIAEHAQQFSINRFHEEMKGFIEEKLEES